MSQSSEGRNLFFLNHSSIYKNQISGIRREMTRINSYFKKPYLFKTGKPGNRPAHNFYFFVMYYYVYLLQSMKTKKFYVGFTSNLKKRLSQHNNGENQSTKAGAPYELVYFEGFKSKKDALIREKN